MHGESAIYKAAFHGGKWDSLRRRGGRTGSCIRCDKITTIFHTPSYPNPGDVLSIGRMLMEQTGLPAVRSAAGRRARYRSAGLMRRGKDDGYVLQGYQI